MFYLEYATTTALRMLLDVTATLLHTGAVGTDWTGHVATRRRWEGQKYPKVGYFAGGCRADRPGHLLTQFSAQTGPEG